MKKIFILASAITLSTTMYAQKFTKGKYFVGSSSNLSWSSETGEGEGAKSVSSTNLDLGGGYFVMDNLMVKAQLSYNKIGDGKASTGYGVGARYYLKDKFFGQGMFNIPEEKFSTIGLGAGYVHSLNDFITIEPMLSYDMNRVEGKTFSTTLGIRVGLGIYF